MNIVILDLEWNTTYFKRKDGFVNEIIEFGAVKLDGKLNEIDSFSALVNSNKKHLLRSAVKKMTNISNDELLKNGMHFTSVISMFCDWIGENAIIATWSKSDLYSLIENCDVYLSTNKIQFLENYIDLQEFVQNNLNHKVNNQISLLSAADVLNVKYDDSEMHRAINDSRLSARILRSCYDEKKFYKSVADADNEEFYERLFFKPYVETNIKSPYINKNDFVFNCEDCNSILKKKTRWQYKNKAFYSNLYCSKCDKNYIGRVQVKKTYDDILVKRSLIISIIDENIVSTQNELAIVIN